MLYQCSYTLSGWIYIILTSKQETVDLLGLIWTNQPSTAGFMLRTPNVVGTGVINLTDTHTPAQHKMLLMYTSSYWLKAWSCSFCWAPPPGAELHSQVFRFVFQESPQLTSGHAPAWSLQLNHPLRLYSFQSIKDKSLGNTCQGQQQTKKKTVLRLILPLSRCFGIYFFSCSKMCVV